MDKAENDDCVPFFHEKRELDAYLGIFLKRLNVYVDLIDWRETKMRNF